MATDKMMADDDKLVEHRKAVADAIDKLSGYKDAVASPEAGKVRDALMHMGRAHNALRPVAPPTPTPTYPYDY